MHHLCSILLLPQHPWEHLLAITHFRCAGAFLQRDVKKNDASYVQALAGSLTLWPHALFTGMFHDISLSYGKRASYAMLLRQEKQQLAARGTFLPFRFISTSPLILVQLYSPLKRIPPNNPPYFLLKPIPYTLRSNPLAELRSHILACWCVRWGKSSFEIGSCLVAEDGREEGVLEADVGVV